MKYRRLYQHGGVYFFTVVTKNRRKILIDADHIAHLRNAFRYVKRKRPFIMDAIVILPDHLHCIWRLPEGDDGFSARWMLIKRDFSLHVHAAIDNRRSKQIWQPRFWEHLIRDEEDWRRHMDYIYFNPVKHGYVSMPKDWPHSSFKQAVEKGWYDENWGLTEPEIIKDLDFE